MKANKYSKHLSVSTRIASLLAVSVLAACGGGGGGGGSSTGTNVTSVSIQTVPIVTTAPAAPTNYNTEELAAYNRFNTARSTCGFGYLQRNANLDTAAVNHVTYMVDNNVISHNETSGLPAFTGIYPSSRMTAAGYAVSSTNNEVFATQTGTSSAGFGTILSRRLLGAPYHLADLMQGNRDIGVTVKTGGGLGSGADITYAGASSIIWLLADMASSSSNWEQVQDSTTVLTYPCNGVTDTLYQLTTETPNPVPSRDLSSQPIGQPIYVRSAPNTTLVISTVTVTGPSGSVALLPTMTSANDPNSVLRSNEALIMPSAPLAQSSVYSVTLTGTTSGTSFTKSFSFSTGSSI